MTHPVNNGHINDVVEKEAAFVPDLVAEVRKTIIGQDRLAVVPTNVVYRREAGWV